MIITNKFAWGHFQKTGGTTIGRLFENLFKENIVYADSEFKHEKHDTFKVKSEKGVIVPDIRILNIRRLPEWVVSFLWFSERCTNIEYKKDNYYKGTILDREFGKAQDKIISRNIDEYLKSYFDKPITDFIRMEYLNEDFISVFGKYINILDDQKRKIKNAFYGQGHYNKFEKYFNEKEIKQMYIDCPFWAKIEKQVYGNLLYT